MKKTNILKEKSFSFSESIIQICRYLKGKRKESSIISQLYRSGTAVGALIREAEFAQSKADFINKLSIALKEANETDYWLNLLKESGDLDAELFIPTENLSREIISMLVCSVKTAKRNGI